MSRSRGRQRRQWQPQPWDQSSVEPALDHGPVVVNATLNFATNQFDITEMEPEPPRRNMQSKFDFGVNQQDSTQWRFDAQQGWGTAPQMDDTAEPWGTERHQDDVAVPRFSSKEHQPETFRLNLEIPDQPYFSKVVDYTSFRQRSIIPEIGDLLPSASQDDVNGDWQQPPMRRIQQIPNVPLNRVKEPYDNTDQYLYTHFELLRNDFLIPLRSAVRSYQAFCNKGHANTMTYDALAGDAQLPRDFRLYEHVHLNAIVFGARQVLYRVSFRLPHYVRVKWEQSKRLIEGSMVLLSKDNFEKDIKVATVVYRGEKPMKGANRFEYLIDLHLERDNDADPLGFGDPSTAKQDTYVMIEATGGYFEAYRHVLSVIQNIPSDALPFSQYLVDVSPDVRLPHYAAVKQFYDISLSKEKRFTMTVNITKVWPQYEINMDHTQMDALKTILSNNLAIVQGPPGTGKTYVGTYAMRVLLNNFPNSIGPIVCVCQTNHALDQFLERILDYDDRIVRIGSRSKSELLKDHVIFELRKTAESTRGIGRLYKKRNDLTNQIKQIITELYEEPCVTLEYVRKIQGLSPRQLESLKRLGEREQKRATVGQLYTNQADDDDDDEWVISTDAKPSFTPRPVDKRNNRNDRRGGRKGGRGGGAGGSSVPSSWERGNPNIQTETKESAFNPIEAWLKDAIEYVDGSSPLNAFTEDMKEDLLEQQQGLIFETNDDAEDFVEEDELQEITQNFSDESDLRGNKTAYINIGNAYCRQSAPVPQLDTLWNRVVENRTPVERTLRKIVKYDKIDAPRTFDTSSFNFFEDTVNPADLEPQHMVLERWLKEEQDASLWPLPVRLKAHKKWVHQRNQEIGKTLRALMENYKQVCQEIRKANVLADAKICLQNRVVGMTSTAAAKYHDLLEEIKPRIMVVEEAAEMLEAHIISSMTMSLQHLVLIGDHQQLRPQNAVHTLAEQHFLNVSLFERLVMNNMPFTRLSHQRRMRPEIRMFIDPIYSDPPLRDHPDVMKYPPIRGMDQSVFFVSHYESESHVADSASKCNEHEAALAAKLSVYLLQQGYRPDEITIITMYAGQRSLIKRYLRQERRPEYDSSLVAVSSVDGFQGEENTIIILSLVRSNTQGAIGFLKVANRVCVSLSRAKHGMYVLGNAALLCEKSDLWNEIVANLEDQPREMIGSKLKLRCQRHNRVTEVQWPVDLATVPEGGCTMPCGETLSCGHQCELPCHPYDHEQVRCQQACVQVMKGCRHRCMRRCYEPCGPCLQTVRVNLRCGHEVEGECSKLRKLMESPAGIQCPKCSRG